MIYGTTENLTTVPHHSPSHQCRPHSHPVHHKLVSHQHSSRYHISSHNTDILVFLVLVLLLIEEVIIITYYHALQSNVFLDDILPYPHSSP